MKKHNKKVDGILSPEEVYGTNNDCVITRCALYLLLLAVCVVALIETNKVLGN